MKTTKLNDLTCMALCISIGFVTKRIVTPVTNILTDFIRIPGGSLATGFSIMFLCIGVYRIRVFGCGTMMGLAQGCLALFLGRSGPQGVWVVITYSFPGLVIDLVNRYKFKDPDNFFLLSCAAGTAGSAVLANILIFRLSSLLLALWLLAGVISGIIGGWLGGRVYRYLKRAL